MYNTSLTHLKHLTYVHNGNEQKTYSHSIYTYPALTYFVPNRIHTYVGTYENTSLVSHLLQLTINQIFRLSSFVFENIMLTTEGDIQEALF